MTDVVRNQGGSVSGEGINVQNQGAGRLKNAQARLGAAVESLDAVLVQGAGPDRAGDAEIKALQSENADLKGVLGQAFSRLDTLIEQLKTRQNI